MFIKWIVAGIVLLAGLMVIAGSFRSSRRLFFGQEVTLAKYLVGAGLSGVSVCLVLLGIILVIGALDPEYEWTATRLIGVTALSLIAGLVAAVGSLWSYYAAGKFREALLRWLQKRQGK
jgi:hypothetical protein